MLIAGVVMRDDVPATELGLDFHAAKDLGGLFRLAGRCYAYAFHYRSFPFVNNLAPRNRGLLMLNPALNRPDFVQAGSAEPRLFLLRMNDASAVWPRVALIASREVSAHIPVCTARAWATGLVRSS